MQGQKSITLAEKEMADLVYITDETLQHKVICKVATYCRGGNLT